jgi:hypothetical protein
MEERAMRGKRHAKLKEKASIPIHREIFERSKVGKIPELDPQR